MDPVKFFSSTQAHFQLSNYFPVKILVDGINYPSSEHFYQSQKFVHEGASKKSLKYAKIVATAKTPNMARELASQKIKGGYGWRTNLNVTIAKYQDVEFDPLLWDKRKDNVMRKVVFQKFIQHENLKELLLSTGSARLIEASPYDSYWGEGKKEDGLNMLGKILMETRYLLSCGTLSIIDNPTPTSFWIIPNVLLASAYPGHPDKTIHEYVVNSLLEAGINAFVDLMIPEEKGKLNLYDLPKEVFYSNVPIRDRSVLTDEGLKCVTKGVLMLIANKNITLVHCFGGKGRTGTVMCAVLCELYGIKGHEAISLIHKYFGTRKDKGKRGLNLLTSNQRKQITRMYS